MSTFLATQELKEGDKLSIMPPTGNFLLDTDESNNNHYVGIAAGSGITPIMSMIKNVLINEPLSSFTLIYGNKTKSSIMYLDEINLFRRIIKIAFRYIIFILKKKTTILYLAIFMSYSRIYYKSS